MSDDERVLVVTPAERDAAATCDILKRAGIACMACADLDLLVRELGRGAGALLIAGEALNPDNLPTLAAALERQEPWSDLPVLVAVLNARPHPAYEALLRRLPAASSVTLLQRPIPTVTMITLVRSALSARRRQYQRRDLLVELRSINERLEAERDVRQGFVSILAHDLRGPLSAIRFAADLLAREDAPAERRGGLALRMSRSIDRMDRMIRDLLDVHRIQARQRLPLRLDHCDLGVVAREVAEELNVTHVDRIVVGGEERVEGIWSAEELHRALWNLGTNAIKYGHPLGPIAIRVGTTQDAAWVSVHNEGPAIPQEEQPKLFEPFRRSAPPGAEGQHGWGLGLALVRGCAEAHGGTVEVESLPDKGTTFTIRLPWDARPFQRGAPT